MYAVPSSYRIYISLLFCLCASFFLAPSVANSATTLRPDIQSMLNEVSREMSNNVNRPSGSTISTAPSAPTVTKNASGGLSPTIQNTIRTGGYPSNFGSTSNYSLDSAKNALKTCVRSPACAGRALGAGGVIYEGIQGWKDVYNYFTDDSGGINERVPKPVPPQSGVNNTCRLGSSLNFPSCADAYSYEVDRTCNVGYQNPQCPLTMSSTSGGSWNILGAPGGLINTLNLISNVCDSGSTNSFEGCVSDTETVDRPVSDSEWENAIDVGYNPEPSDAPIVITGPPQTITLSTPASVQLPSTTTTSTDSNGVTTTSVVIEVLDYTVINNGTANPSIESSVQRLTNTYDSTGNQIATKTETTNNPAVSPTPVPAPAPSPSPSTPIDFELPSFCSWASIVCDFIGWVKEPLSEEEPDLSQLISEFEPDEDAFDLGISDGSCPAPIQLHLSFIGKTVEVSYDPFCDFLLMIRPFVIAAAYLFAAYIYLGVLKRG